VRSSHLSYRPALEAITVERLSATLVKTGKRFNPQS
jgi:hypothetical protein